MRFPNPRFLTPMAVLLCCGILSLGCPAPTSSCGDGGVDAGDGGVDAGADGGDGGGTTTALGVQQFIEAYCAYQVRCGIWEPSLVSECNDLYLHAVDYSAYVLGAQRGGITVDEKVMADCLSRLPTASCSSGGGCSPTPFAPKVANGGSCLSRWECADDSAECRGDLTCGRTCVPTGGLSQSCTPNTQPPCTAGLRCDEATNTCVPLPASGEPCATVSPKCSPGLYCDSTTSTCVASPAVGQACGPTAPQCAASAYCSSGVCVAKLGRGARCLLQTCDTGLSCDAVLRTCERPSMAWDAGTVCTGDVLGCDVGFFCRNASINPDGGAGVTGLCDPPQLGDRCSSSAMCPLRTTCIGGVCAYTKAGAPCVFDSNCPETDACGPNSTCAKMIALGELCTTDTRCAGGAVCTSLAAEPAVYRCRTPGGAGAACGPDVGQSSPPGPCRFPYQCIDGHCTHTGGAGEDCFSGACFFGAACRDPDGGLGFVAPGVCGAKAAEGEFCLTDGSCVTGWCDSESRTCARPCP